MPAVLTCREVPANLRTFIKVMDLSNDKYVRVLMDLYKSYPGDKRSVAHSIAGGYCRNILAGLSEHTDLDIVPYNLRTMQELLQENLEVISEENFQDKYKILDNEAHFAHGAITEEVDGVLHVVASPHTFDFTVNLASISCVDGCMYAPPATLYDIKNRIIRPCKCIDELYELENIIDLPIALRAIRFALKYNMKIYKPFMGSIIMLFALQNYIQKTDDKALYYFLKRMQRETSDLRTRVYNALREMNFIDTDKYSSFDDYMKYIQHRVATEPRELPFATGKFGHYL